MSSTSTSSRERNIAILGGGVLGLTTALELASSHPTTPSTPRLNIHILARDLASTPSGLLSQQWASPWAGFNWCSFATKDDTVTQSRDRLAYLEWKRIVETGELPGSTMARMPFVQYLPEGVTQDDIWFKDFVDDFEYHPHSSTSDPRPCIKYTSFGVNTPLYLAYLIERLRSFDYVDGSRVSISFHQTETFESLAEAYAYCRKKEFAPPDTAGSSSSKSEDDSWLLINATGLGSLTLLDVLDKEVYPIRGQTILLRVPPAFSNSPRCVMDVISPPAYLIPRGAGSGQVILGGTFGNDEWDTRVSEEDTERILRECWRLCPDILDGTAGGGEEAVEMLRKQTISVNVGLRPARRGDVARVELDAVKVKNGEGEERVPVLHCYGAGRAGYQSSLGIAKEAKELVEAHYREIEG